MDIHMAMAQWMEGLVRQQGRARGSTEERWISTKVEVETPHK